MFVILLAGLTAIPPNLYEAAELDGVGAWQAFWSITVPHLAPMIAARDHLPPARRDPAVRHHLHHDRRRAGHQDLYRSFYLYTVGFTQFHLSQATAGSWMFLILTAARRDASWCGGCLKAETV